MTVYDCMERVVGLSNEAKRLARAVYVDPSLRDPSRQRARALEQELLREAKWIRDARAQGELVDEDAELYVSEGILDVRFVESPGGTLSLRLGRFAADQRALSDSQQRVLGAPVEAPTLPTRSARYLFRS